LPRTALRSSAYGPSSGKKNKFAPAAPLSPDFFDGFPTPKGFDTKPGLAYTSQQQQESSNNNSNNNSNASLQNSPSNAWLPSNQDDDSAISFPSLPDPTLAASSASKAAARGDLLNVPPPPTPPTEEYLLQPPPTILNTGTNPIPAPPIAEKSKSSSKLERKASGKEGKKKKKKRHKGQKAGRKESSGRDVTSNSSIEIPAAPKKVLLTAEILAEQMAHEQRPEDTPQPSSLSGMRFDELYRLRGVVRYLFIYLLMD
jgi:hypothetical protein